METLIALPSYNFKHLPYPHSRMAAGQVAKLGHIQAPSRHTQTIESVFQAYHQGAPGRGQCCRMPCEEHMGERWMWVRRYAKSRVSQYFHLRFPFLVARPPYFAPYLPSLSQAQGCPHPLCAEILVHLGQLCVDHSPSTSKRGMREKKWHSILTHSPSHQSFP